MRFYEDADQGPLNPSLVDELFHLLFPASEPMFMSSLRQKGEAFKVPKTVITDANHLPGVTVLSGVFTWERERLLVTVGRSRDLGPVAPHAIDSADEIADVAQQYQIPAIAAIAQAKPPLQYGKQVFVGR